MSPYRSPVSPMGMVYGILEGLGSVPIIHILQGLFNVQLLYKRYSGLQIITFLARHVKLVPLDRYLYLEFGSLYRLADFAGQITFNSPRQILPLVDLSFYTIYRVIYFHKICSGDHVKRWH